MVQLYEAKRFQDVIDVFEGYIYSMSKKFNTSVETNRKDDNVKDTVNVMNQYETSFRPNINDYQISFLFRALYKIVFILEKKIIK